MSEKPASPPPEQEPAEEHDRQVQPVDAEEAPHLAFPVVGIGASAGGLEAVSEFLQRMRADSGMAFVLIQHLPPDRESLLAEILGKRTTMPVSQVEDGVPVEANHVYVIRPGHVVTIRDGTLHLGPVLNGPRAANRPIDDFFKSLAEEQRERAVAIIMSGMGSNGTAGAQAIKAVGGLCVAQDPESAQFPSMPRHLIDAGYADYILRPADIPEVLLAYAGHPYASGGREADAEVVLRQNRSHLREIIAVLRSRIRQDFNGYKKPTVLRRVQRRMGLARVTKMGDYAKLLRQSPTEVIALADDLLIHVTGFFRDADSWETLLEKVIVPLIAGRESGGRVRCWVTACSSGEEAYSLAILLSEEAERVGKELDIKVFATDMAERSLAHARAGIYPGGIEAEVLPERLNRYFQREDAVYRVRPELRERVVFAPQNILQDPPFSRLDIASCRNLLIYLEPEVQQRVLGLLHFGLRDGGALFLGSSETLGGTDEMFEPIDKKARIFRRIGPTRHGATDFPLPHSIRLANEESARNGLSTRSAFERRAGPRATLAQITQRTLLEHHLPAAVFVDRDHRVLYFQGNTRPFLEQPTGEPTRDLMLLAREGIRGAARRALQQAAARNITVTIRDGWLKDESGGRRHVAVTASPAQDNGSVEYLVLSFEILEPAAADAQSSEPSNGDAGNAASVGIELRRVREELQSTIEELQTSNEEMKASNEEVTSINEELQSANEELETSKEEMHSLNEELSTVNAQLQSKVEEHLAASNDLASLLTSTDIAVIFLDTNYRIRRFTPAVRDLFELISTDIGRPLNDLARKFKDAALSADVESVLTRLVPQEREVVSDAGRWFLRRVTPYRTIDNRIDGVVIAFIDITGRKTAEDALRESQDRYRSLFNSMDESFAVKEPVLDAAGNIVDFRCEDSNPAFGRYVGFDPRGRSLRELVPGIETRWIERYAQVLRTGESVRFQDRIASQDRWLDVFASRMAGPQSHRLAVLFTDITARKRGESALRESEERLRLMIEGAKDFAIFLMDAGGRVTTWNVGAERVTGYSETEAIGQETAFIFTEEDRAAGAPAKELATAALEGRAADERWHVRKGGARFWANGVMHALRGEDGATVRGFVKVLRDDTVRKLAEDAVREAKTAAESANQLKDEFLATLSHELRTPLSAILIWAKILQDGRADAAQFKEGLAAIESSAEAQKEMIEDLLDTSRITSGKVGLKLKEVDLLSIVGGAVETIEPTAESKNVILGTDLDQTAGTVLADADRLRQVIWNLLTNAVKFTPAGGTVNIALKRQGDEIVLRVVDSGRGVAADFIPHMFDLFRQADSSSTRRHGGLGIGLAISKKLVELHGGTITVESAGVDQGATFTVELPLPRIRSGRTAAPALAKVADIHVEADLRGMKILLVENEIETRNAIVALLKEAGTIVTAVGSADEALKAYRAARPDMLLSDIGLPDVDGHEIIRRIRRIDAADGASRTPAIALTAFARPEDRERALKAGFDHYLSKPFAAVDLLAFLSSTKSL